MADRVGLSLIDLASPAALSVAVKRDAGKAEICEGRSHRSVARDILQSSMSFRVRLAIPTSRPLCQFSVH